MSTPQKSGYWQLHPGVLVVVLVVVLVELVELVDKAGAVVVEVEQMKGVVVVVLVLEGDAVVVVVLVVVEPQLFWSRFQAEALDCQIHLHRP